MNTHATSGLIDQVDRLVREETISQITIGEVGRRNNGLVSETNRMVGLVAILETHQNVNGVRQRRLVDLHRLEPTFERRVFLQIFPVFLERRCAHRLKFTAGQHWLQDRSSVNGALCSAGTDERMYLVYEEDDVAAALDLFENLLETLFKITAIAGARYQRSQVKGV